MPKKKRLVAEYALHVSTMLVSVAAVAVAAVAVAAAESNSAVCFCPSLPSTLFRVYFVCHFLLFFFA